MGDFPFRRAPEPFKRKVEERKKEARKAKEKHIDSSDLQNIKNKLGYTQRTKEYKVIAELKRLSRKKPKTWKAIGLTEKDFKAFGIKV